MAKDRQKLRSFVAALHVNGIPGSKSVSKNCRNIQHERYRIVKQNIRQKHFIAQQRPQERGQHSYNRTSTRYPNMTIVKVRSCDMYACPK